MLGGVGGITQQHRSRPFWSFLFFKRGCRCFQIAFVSYCGVHATRRRFVAFVSYYGVHATRRFLLHLYLIAMSMRRVDSLENYMQALHYHSKWDRVAPPMCFLICTTFMFLVHGFFHQTGAIKTRTFTCIHVYYMSWPLNWDGFHHWLSLHTCPITTHAVSLPRGNLLRSSSLQCLTFSESREILPIWSPISF